MRRSSLMVCFVLLFMVTLLAGCGAGDLNGKTAQQETAKISDEPVNLLAFFDAVSDPLLEKLIIDETKLKHPNITLEFIPSAGNNLNSMILSGSVPDILFTFPGNLSIYTDRGLLFDMSPIIKTNKFDLGRFKPELITDVMATSLTNQLVALPYTQNFFALYYNKDLFDRFAVPYPKAGMTWDQTIEIAKRMTRNENGTQYAGFDISNLDWAAFAYSARPVDYKTEKSAVNSEIWKKVLQLGYSINTIPGNVNPGGKNGFVQNRTLAMLAYTNIVPELETAVKDGLNWDVTQFPSFADKPGVIGTSYSVVNISNTSKHKDRALQVIDVITSEKVQTEYAKLGKVSPLKSESIRKAFETGTDSLKSKRLQDVFLGTLALYPITTKYNAKASSILNKHIIEYYSGKIDLNTTMLRADEEINSMIAGEKAK